MGTEISEIGEYALYILYLLLVIATGLFLYSLQKRKLSVNIEEKEKKKNSYKVDNTLLKQQQKHILKDEVKVLKKDSSKKEFESDIKDKDIVKRPIEKTIEIKDVYKENIDIYEDAMPPIEGVKPHFFKYFKGQKLLIVEDNKINQKILLNVLNNIDTPIDVADNGQEAIDKVFDPSNQYDMILMDISMPVMDGINATASIRAKDLYDNIPIVTVTAFTSGVEIKQMFEAGANAFLTKPLDIQKLFTVMLLFLDNTKSDLSITDEFEIVGIDLNTVENTINANKDDLKEAIEEFINKFEYLEDKIPMWIDNHDFIEVQNALDELDMILDLIGAKKMQIFIEQMKNALQKAEDINSYKILFKAQYKALLNTYRKYLNSI